MNAIELIDLSIGYDRHAVLTKINAAIQKARITCLIGTNGIGKSTLLRTLSAFQPALSGQILIGGTPIEQFTQHDLARKIGVVLTEKIEISNITVTELTGLGRSPYTNFWGGLTAADHDIVRQALQMVGIADLADRKIQTLSDGERQKVIIAKALAQQTPVIILDEPTAFLDFQSKIEILQLLSHLAHKYGKTVFLSIHDVDLALQTADELWLIDCDKQLHTGTPDELIKDGSFARFIENEYLIFDPDARTIRIKK